MLQLVSEHALSLCVLLCSCSLYGALEEAADETQLCLGPHRVWRGGGGEITPHVF